MTATRRALAVAAASAMLIAGCSKAPVARPRHGAQVRTVRAEVSTATPTREDSPSVEPARHTPPLALPALRPRLVCSVPSAGKRVALTFDLCEAERETSGFDERIADYLADNNVAATFFMGGKWADSHPAAARRLAKQPLFEIGNHSWSHPHFEKLSSAAADRQIDRAQARIARVTGRTPRLFRFPFGTHSADSLEAVGRAGLVAIEWDVVTGDPDPNIEAGDILHAVRDGTHPGSIIIMHANGRGHHTAEALPSVVAWLRERGFELVTVSDLLAAETP